MVAHAPFGKSLPPQDCSFIYRSGRTEVYWPLERAWFAEFSWFSDRDQPGEPASSSQEQPPLLSA
eukprot:scaffold8536_cov248-Pinguiococcus_pyrenoidosus.AAC.11